MSPDCNSVVMSNMWFGLMVFKKSGDLMEGHKHKFDHCTLLSYGQFRVIKYDLNNEIEINEVVDSPCLIHIAKENLHSIEALTDDARACCCHAIYEDEKDLFPIDVNKVPIVGGSLKLSLTEMNHL